MTTRIFWISHIKDSYYKVQLIAHKCHAHEQKLCLGTLLFKPFNSLNSKYLVVYNFVLYKNVMHVGLWEKNMSNWYVKPLFSQLAV